MYIQVENHYKRLLYNSFIDVFKLQNYIIYMTDHQIPILLYPQYYIS